MFRRSSRRMPARRSSRRRHARQMGSQIILERTIGAGSLRQRGRILVVGEELEAAFFQNRRSRREGCPLVSYWWSASGLQSCWLQRRAD